MLKKIFSSRLNEVPKIELMIEYDHLLLKRESDEKVLNAYLEFDRTNNESVYGNKIYEYDEDGKLIRIYNRHTREIIKDYTKEEI